MLFFTIFYIRKDTIDVFVISHDEILKAFGWLKGDFFWLGPEVPYKRHYLPGPFMYLLLMPPLIVSKTPYAGSIIWLIVWISLTFTVAFSFLKTICKENMSLFLFVCLMLTSIFMFDGLLFLQWNTIFSLFFHLLALIFLYRWVEEERDFYLSFLGIIMGLGLQLHYSILLHLITLSVFLITSERLQISLQVFTEGKYSKNNLNKKTFEWKHLFAFCTFFLLPQVPYIFACMNKEIYFPILDPYHAFWLIDEFFLNFLKNIKDIVFHMDLNFSRFIVILSICTVMYIYKFKTKEPRPSFPPIMNLSLICVSPLLAGFLFPASLFFMGLFSTILFIKWHDELWPKNQILKTLFFLFYGLSLSILPLDKKLFLLSFLFVLGLIMVIILFFLYNKNQKQSLNILKIFIVTIVFFSIFYNRTIVYKGKTYQLKELMGVIYEATGWEPEEALNRIFVIGFKPNRSFSFSYLLAMEEKVRAKRINELQKNYGYFIIDQKKLKEFIKKYPYHKIRDYLLSDYNVSKEVRQEITNETLTFKPLWKTERYLLYEYKTEKNSMFPEGFHNVPTMYKEPRWFKDVCYFSGLFKKGSTIYFCYLFNGYQETIAMSMNFSRDENRRAFVNAEIYGYPLTVVDASRVVLFHLMKDIKIELDCNESEVIDMISYIGFPGGIKSDFYKSFFAPLKIKQPVNCSLEEIKQITLYFEHQKGYGELQKQSFFIKL